MKRCTATATPSRDVCPLYFSPTAYLCTDKDRPKHTPTPDMLNRPSTYTDG